METENLSPQIPKPNKRYVSNEQALLNYDIIFTNVATQPLIQTELADFGYNAAKIAEGKKLVEAARKAYENNKREDAETVATYKIFYTQAEALWEVYTLHRKRAKVCFRHEPELIKQLGVEGALPDALARRLEEAENFYRTIKELPTIATPLTQFKITPEVVTKVQKQIADLRIARADYLREKGESQDATQQKDEAFKAAEAWLSDFFAVARIVLEDNPKLLASLTK